MLKRKKQQGFTLVELIVVIAILAILATLLVPTIMGNVSEAKKETAVSNGRTVASEVTTYNAMQSDPDKMIKKIDEKTVPTVHPMSAAEFKTITDYVTFGVDDKGNATSTVKATPVPKETGE
jgi:prepilin-type N-terminal cleavage/methylation domain-containing protein